MATSNRERHFFEADEIERTPAISVFAALLLTVFLLTGCAGSGADNPALVIPDAAAKMRVADAARQARDYGTAIRLYNRLIEDEPSEIVYRLSLAESYVEVNAFQDAISTYEDALALRGSSDNKELHNGLARIYLALNQPAEAKGYFSTALEIDEEDLVALNGIAVTLDRLGEHEEAQAAYAKIMDNGKGNAAIRNNYAMSLILSAEYDRAIDILTRLAMSHHANPQVRQNLALALGLKGDQAGAEKVAGVDLDKNSVDNNLKYYAELRKRGQAKLAE
jgi:Flp pilus assembly protein TadD